MQRLSPQRGTNRQTDKQTDANFIYIIKRLYRTFYIFEYMFYKAITTYVWVTLLLILIIILFNILKYILWGSYLLCIHAILKIMMYYYFLYYILITINYKGLLNCIWLSLDSKVLSTKVVWEPWWAWGYSMLAYITNTNNYQPNDGYGIVNKDSHMQHKVILQPCLPSLIQQSLLSGIPY